MLLRIVVLFVAAQLTLASNREMLVSSNDPAGVTKTFPFDKTLLPGMNDPPESDPWIVRKAIGLEPEQVSVVYFGQGRVLISWVTGLPQIGPNPVSMSPAGLDGQVKIGTTTKIYTKVVKGTPVTYKQDYTSISQPSYASGLIYHALVTITPGAKHFYIVGDAKYDIWSTEYSFTAVPAVTPARLPFRIGVMSDIGQTYNTTQMLQNIKKSNPQLILNLGDFTYADTYAPAGYNKFVKPYTGIKGPISYQGRWDTFGRLYEMVAAYIPQLHVSGNHEIESQTVGGKTYTQTSYSARYPVPRGGGTGYSTANNDNIKSVINNMYYTVNVPGATLIFLNPYVKGETFSPTSTQYIWLVSKLKLVDRKVTPWLIVSFHAPWYNTYVSHFKEAECMRQAYEPLFKQYGVDVVLTGHVHAYERSKPVYNYKIDNVCGAVHITVGDGGNQEKLAKDFIDQTKAPPSWCTNPASAPVLAVNPKRCTYREPDGSYCYKAQPAWSAYREPSFGHGILTIESATTAKWEWYRAHEKGVKVSDSVTITRNPTKCGALAQG